MKRDCGPGELVPTKFFILYNVGISDKALRAEADQFDALLPTLPPCSNIRLYAEDRAGYRNCIRSAYISPEGEVSFGPDRRAECAGEVRQAALYSTHL
jgi:hypothetical protein